MEKVMKRNDVEPLRIRQFEVGDLVFAKLKGYPPWPSKINQIESIISGGKEKTRYNVYFYGTHQSSILRSSSLYHYDTYAKSIVDKWGRKQKFHEALKELEREMMDKITYMHQLRTTTPDNSWCPGFSNACEGLVNDIDGKQLSTKSKNHKQKQMPQKKRSVSPMENNEEEEDKCDNDSRRLGYKVRYMERIPFPDTPESLLIVSLSFDKDWVKEESERLRNEERMMNCHVRIEPLPLEYAHLDKRRSESKLADGNSLIQNGDGEVQERSLTRGRSMRTAENSFNLTRSRGTKSAVSTQRRSNGHEKPSHSRDSDAFVTRDSLDANNHHLKDVSDGSDSEGAVEMCPICRSCFFSQTELKNHEKSVHGGVATAETLFDRLLNGNDTFQVTKSQPTPHKSDRSNGSVNSSYFKEGYSLDSQIPKL